MKRLPHLLLFACVCSALCACRTHREAVASTAHVSDSLAVSVRHRTTSVSDTSMRLTAFDFDTLEVWIERPLTPSDSLGLRPAGSETVRPYCSETLRLRAVNGRVRDSRLHCRDSVAGSSLLDSVAWRHAAATESSELSDATLVCDPPDGTAVFVAVLLLAALLLFLALRKD